MERESRNSLSYEKNLRNVSLAERLGCVISDRTMWVLAWEMWFFMIASLAIPLFQIKSKPIENDSFGLIVSSNKATACGFARFWSYS